MKYVILLLSFFANYHSYAGPVRSPDIIFENTNSVEIYQKIQNFVKERNLTFRYLKKNKIEIFAPKGTLSLIIWENSLNQTGVAIKEKSLNSKNSAQWKNILIEAMKTWGLKVTLNKQVELEPERMPSIKFTNISSAEVYEKTLAFIEEQNLSSRTLKNNIKEIYAPAPYEAVLSLTIWLNSLNETGIAIARISGKTEHFKEYSEKLLAIMSDWDEEPILADSVYNKFSRALYADKTEKLVKFLEKYEDYNIINNKFEDFTFIVNNVKMRISFYPLIGTEDRIGFLVSHISGDENNFNALNREIILILSDKN
ncbi:MAG: hypothetical protein AB8G05_02585 [Oligoflexales bacterium]